MTQNYIERYWRDARQEDAIKEPPMACRMRFDESGDWYDAGHLMGCDRSSDEKWITNEWQDRQCQVYDAPDPGEGYELIDPDIAKRSPSDERWYPAIGKWLSPDDCFCDRYQDGCFYRRRITPAVTYVPFTWEDREQLRGRWAIIKQPNRTLREECVDNVAITEDGNFYINGHDPVYLLQNATFIDTGKPVGKEVVQ